MRRLSEKWLIVVAMTMPLFMLTADINGLTVALPTIGRDFGVSTTTLQWVINVYLLAFASFLLPVGRLGDIVGRRLVLLAGVAIFGAASIISGIAPNEGVLLVGRAAQGIGAAAFFSQSLSVVSNAFPAEERGKAIGIWSATGVTGAAAGPILGGILTDLASWRWFFLVNIPISVIAFAMVWILVKESRDETASRRLDIVGFVLVTAGLVGVVFAIQQLDDSSITSPGVLWPLIGGGVALVAFVLLELRLAEPLVDFLLFRSRAYLTTAVLGAISQWLFFSFTFFMTLYLQNVLGLSAIDAGLVFLALSVTFIVASIKTGTAVEKLGIRMGMTIGIGLMGVGPLIAIFLGTDQTTGVALVTVAYVVFAIGNVWAYNISTAGGMSAVADSKAGVASGMLSSSKFVTGAFGLAVVGLVFKTVENNDLEDAVSESGLPASEVSEVEGLLSGSEEAVTRLGELSPALAGEAQATVNDAFLTGLTAAMILNVVVAAATMAVGLLYRPSTRPAGDDAPSPAAPAAPPS